MIFTFTIKKISDTITPQIKSIENAIGTAGRKKVLIEVANKFKNMAQSTFGANKNTYRGNTWPRYSKLYAKKVGSFTPTLLRTSKLKSSINVTNPQSNSITVQSDIKYSAAQFFGNKKGLPSRKYFPVEGQGIMWRLTARADRDLMIESLRNFYNLSNGALPQNLGMFNRMTYSAGNPFSD